MKYPLALICRDNENLDIYNLGAAECVKSLKHESKVSASEPKNFFSVQKTQKNSINTKSKVRIFKDTFRLSHDDINTDFLIKTSKIQKRILF